MNRREIITLIGSAAAAWPLATRAQQAGKLPTIGFLGASTSLAWTQWTAAFVQRLRELGWIDGRTVAIEYRWAEGRSERYADIAAEFVRLKVNVIVTVGSAVAATKQVLRRFRSSLRLRWTRSEAEWWLRWRDRAATPPAFRFSPPNLMEADWMGNAVAFGSKAAKNGCGRKWKRGTGHALDSR
jgi:hypothetical protein